MARGIDWGTWTIFEPLLLSVSYGLLGDGGDWECGWLLEIGRLSMNAGTVAGAAAVLFIIEIGSSTREF